MVKKMTIENKVKFVKKTQKNEMLRVAINSDLLSRLKHIREVSKDSIDVNKTIENKIYQNKPESLAQYGRG